MRQLPAPVVGTSEDWARDCAVVGAVSGLLAPGAVLVWVPMPGLVAYLMATTISGLVSGAVLGAAMPSLLERVRGRVPLPMLIVGSPLAGLIWGLAVGLSTAAVVDANIVTLTVMCAPLAGAVLFGAFWFPYTFQTVVGGPRWPVVAVTALMTPVAGWAAALAWVGTVAVGGAAYSWVFHLLF